MKSFSCIWRVDDVVPGPALESLLSLEETLDKWGIRPIIGVVPINQDDSIGALAPYPDGFWSEIRRMKDKGWTVAQHGETHVCTGYSKSFLGHRSASEFAGRSIDIQVSSIQRGKEIFLSEGINPEIFMAPKHSFDRNTLKALKICGFKTITDGWGVAPYQIDGITLVPQVSARFRPTGFGLWTNCIHLQGDDKNYLTQIAIDAKKFGRSSIALQTALDEYPTSGGLGSGVLRFLSKSVALGIRSSRKIRKTTRAL